MALLVWAPSDLGPELAGRESATATVRGACRAATVEFSPVSLNVDDFKSFKLSVLRSIIYFGEVCCGVRSRAYRRDMIILVLIEGDIAINSTVVYMKRVTCTVRTRITITTYYKDMMNMILFLCAPIVLYNMNLMHVCFMWAATDGGPDETVRD